MDRVFVFTVVLVLFKAIACEHEKKQRNCGLATLSLAHLSVSNMAHVLLRILLSLLLLSLITQKSDGENEYRQWCIADEQTPDGELQAAMDWACGEGGADCRKIQVKQGCFFPNTVRDHASYAFNSYFQRFKHKGGSCYFRGAAITTELDPSHNSCHYEFLA